MEHDYLTFSKKFMHVYETFCTSTCKKHNLNQSSYNLILFLANNPSLNTAKDICEIRGIKKGIASVTIERLVQDGYLRRESDPADRRIQRLYTTKKSEPVIEDGRSVQKHFFAMISAGLSEEERAQFAETAQKIRENVIKLEKEID